MGLRRLDRRDDDCRLHLGWGLKDTTSYEQAEYVKKQGWAAMPGEPKPDAKVVDECVRLLMSMS